MIPPEIYAWYQEQQRQKRERERDWHPCGLCGYIALCYFCDPDRPGKLPRDWYPGAASTSN